MPDESSQLIEKLKAEHPDVQFVGAPSIGSAYHRSGPLNPHSSRGAAVQIGELHENMPHILAHELGHHEFQGTRLGRLVQNIPGRLLGMPGIAAPASALAGVAAARSDSKLAPYAAAAVPLAVHAPTLISEGMATHKALQNMKRLGASQAAMRLAKRDLAGAFGSYALNAGLSGGAAALPFVAKKYWNKGESDKQADFTDMAPAETHHLIKRTAQGALLGGGLGALSGAALGLIAPKVFGGVGNAALHLGLAGSGAGSSAGGVLGSYEGGRDPKRTHDPRLLAALGMSPTHFIAGHMGIKDSEKMKQLGSGKEASMNGHEYGQVLAWAAIEKMAADYSEKEKAAGIGGALVGGILGAVRGNKVHPGIGALLGGAAGAYVGHRAFEHLGSRTKEEREAAGKTAFIGPAAEVSGAGVPSGLGYLLGRSQRVHPEHAKEEAEREYSLPHGLLIPGYTGYPYGKKRNAQDVMRAGEKKANSGPVFHVLPDDHPIWQHGEKDVPFMVHSTKGTHPSADTYVIRKSVADKHPEGYGGGSYFKGAGESCSHKQRLSFHKHCPACGEKMSKEAGILDQLKAMTKKAPPSWLTHAGAGGLGFFAGVQAQKHFGKDQHAEPKEAAMPPPLSGVNRAADNLRNLIRPGVQAAKQVVPHAQQAVGAMRPRAGTMMDPNVLARLGGGI